MHGRAEETVGRAPLVGVRGLSLTRAGIALLLAGELRTGLPIGAILGLISFPAVWLAFADVRLAAGTVANGIGMLFPWPASTTVQRAFGL